MMAQRDATIATLAKLFGVLAEVVSAHDAVGNQVNTGQASEARVSISGGGSQYLRGIRPMMVRCVQIALMGLAALWAMAGPASAAEAMMRLRGSDLIFTGDVLSFDGQTYRVESELFGLVNLDIGKFECLSGACAITEPELAVAAGPDFAVYGSNTVGSTLMPELIRAYAESVGMRTNMSENVLEEAEIELLDGQGAKLANIELKTSGSGTAFAALTTRKGQIGMSSRPINAAEATLLPSSNAYVLALDALLVVVSPQNPMTAISTDQLAQVFSGEISDWSDLGQAPGEINVYARNDASGTLDSFKSLALEPAKRLLTPNAIRFRSDGELSDAVADDVRGIGFTSFAYRRNAKPLAISTPCGLAYSPSVFDVKADEYPLSRRLFLYTNLAPAAEHAKGVLSYALSSQAQKTISDAGFIDQSVEYLTFKDQGDRIIGALDTSTDSFDLALMRELIKEVGESSRLSVTLRFRSASFALDSVSQQNVKRLAVLLSSEALRDKEILLLGFSDAIGAFDSNRELSLVRARQVKQALLSAADGKIDEGRVRTRGYSELIPIGCNGDPLGRARNRRVEVWVKNLFSRSPEKKLAEPEGSEEVEAKDALYEEFLRWKAAQ